MPLMTLQLMRKRLERVPIFRNDEDHETYRMTYATGKAMAPAVLWHRVDTLTSDLPSIIEDLGRGDPRPGLLTAANALDLGIDELSGMLGPDGQTRAGVLGFVQAIVDAHAKPSQSEIDRRSRQRVSPRGYGPQPVRKLYGRR